MVSQSGGEWTWRTVRAVCYTALARAILLRALVDGVRADDPAPVLAFLATDAAALYTEWALPSVRPEYLAREIVRQRAVGDPRARQAWLERVEWLKPFMGEGPDA